ncbi:MAG: hypothetical protein ACRD8K_06415 [Nitrososphaeraceae archaeon]
MVFWWYHLNRLFIIITEFQVSSIVNELRRKEKSSNTTSSRGENSKGYC